MQVHYQVGQPWWTPLKLAMETREQKERDGKEGREHQSIAA